MERARVAARSRCLQRMIGDHEGRNQRGVRALRGLFIKALQRPRQRAQHLLARRAGLVRHRIARAIGRYTDDQHEGRGGIDQT